MARPPAALGERTPPGDAEVVIDVGDADFQERVLERSHRQPVVVDFWAPWCGPCRTLGPILERVIQDEQGAVLLARLDVDAAPQTAAHYQVRSIPLLLGFREGSVVSELLGAQPERVVRQWVGALVPSEADRLAEEGRALWEGGHANAAEERFRTALAKEPRHPQALLGLARVLGERDPAGEALALLERLSTGSPKLEQEAERLAAELRTRAAAEAAGDLEASRAQVAANPADLGARLELGRSLAAARRYEEALEELLAVVQQDPGFADGAARRAMLDCFELLGAEHPLTQSYRQALARALFR